MYIIAVSNQKGGVGKTSLCFHLAGALAYRKRRVLLVDMDPQGNLTHVTLDASVAPEHHVTDVLVDDPVVDTARVVRRTVIPGVDILPAKPDQVNLDDKLSGNYDAALFLREALEPIGRDYDFALIDCPPQNGCATQMALVAADGVIVPLECQEWAIEGSYNMVKSIERMRKRLNPDLALMGFVINKIDTRRIIEVDLRNRLREIHGALIFDTEFGDHVQYVEAALDKRPMSFFRPNSIQAKSYTQFGKEVEKHAKKKL